MNRDDIIRLKEERERRRKEEELRKFGRTLDYINAADIGIEKIEWIWPSYWSVGSIFLAAGLPDVGKDTLSYHAMARLTTPNLKWPCNDNSIPPLGNVILLQTEDHLANTVVARMEAAGVDRSRVKIAKMVREGATKRMFSFEQDLELLRKLVDDIGGVVAIFISPISAYFGGSKGTDTYRTSAMRSVLTPLRDFAEEYGIGIWANSHFNKKDDIRNIVLRVSDSLATAALARHVYGIISDPEDEGHKLIIRGKNNLVKAGQMALGFRFGVRFIKTKDDEEVEVPYTEFDPEPIDISAADAMGGTGRPPRQREQAEDIIRAQLADGAKLIRTVLLVGRQEGISENTMRRAAGKLGVIAIVDVDTGRGKWLMPPGRG